MNANFLLDISFECSAQENGLAYSQYFLKNKEEERKQAFIHQCDKISKVILDGLYEEFKTDKNIGCSVLNYKRTISTEYSMNDMVNTSELTKFEINLYLNGNVEIDYLPSNIQKVINAYIDTGLPTYFELIIDYLKTLIKTSIVLNEYFDSFNIDNIVIRHNFISYSEGDQ